MRTQLIATLALAAASVSLPARAADNGFYLGGSVGQSGVHYDDSFEGQSLNYDADSTGFKLIAGWRFLDWLAVEGDYVDLGSGNDKIGGEKVETDVNGVTLSAVGFLPLGPVDLFARVGVINWNADARIPSLDFKASDNGTDFAYGVGAQFRLGSLSLRAEYERFEVSDADTVDMTSLGVTWTFL
jgi:opacity protein-like surface antigen